jgi:hypothetical protein
VGHGGSEIRDPPKEGVAVSPLPQHTVKSGWTGWESGGEKSPDFVKLKNLERRNLQVENHPPVPFLNPADSLPFFPKQNSNQQDGASSGFEITELTINTCGVAVRIQVKTHKSHSLMGLVR